MLSRSRFLTTLRFCCATYLLTAQISEHRRCERSKRSRLIAPERSASVAQEPPEPFPSTVLQQSLVR
jgi:hypothetical protein